jgi:hypothetical protein
MNSVAMGRSVAKPARPRFYLVMSLLMAAIIVGGFSRTVPDDFAQPSGLPLLLYAHGIVFTLWIVLFVSQPAFIVRGSLKLHRKIGMFGAVLAAAMVVMGVAATLHSIRHNTLPSFFPPRIFLVMNIIGIGVFGALVAAGIKTRRKADWHRRLMLCATVSILGPGVGRLLPMESFGSKAPMVMFGVIALFALAGPLNDLLTARKVHPAYYWGVTTIMVSMLVTGPIAFSPIGAAFLQLVKPG